MREESLMSSDTQLRLLDEAELKMVSGGQLTFDLLGARYTLVGNQLTEMLGSTTTTRTLSPAQVTDLQTAYQGVQAGTAASLATANAILNDLRAIGF
jgi:hypothetical protein